MSIYLYSPVCPVRSGQYLNYRSNSVKRMERESYENRISSREYRDFSLFSYGRKAEKKHTLASFISSENQYMLCCIICSQIYSSVFFHITCLSCACKFSHEYTQIWFTTLSLSPISTSLVNYVYQDLLTDCVELE